MLNTGLELARLIGIFDILDIALIAFVIYHIFQFVRRSRSGQVAKAILFILVAMAVANPVGMAARAVTPVVRVMDPPSRTCGRPNRTTSSCASAFPWKPDT